MYVGKKLQGKYTILGTTSLVWLGADQLLIHIFTGTLEYVMGFNVILLCNEKVLILFVFVSLYSLVNDWRFFVWYLPFFHFLCSLWYEENIRVLLHFFVFSCLFMFSEWFANCHLLALFVFYAPQTARVILRLALGSETHPED